MSFFEHRDIRTKILLIILVAGLPLMLLSGYQIFITYTSDYREAEQAIKVTAESIAYQHEAQVQGIRNLLITLSQFPEVKRRDGKACTLLLQNILKQNPSSYNIGIADARGNLIASGINASFSIGDRKYFKDAMRSKRFSVGEYTVSRAVGKAAIHFAQPVLDDHGAVSVVVYATFDLNNFNHIFDAQKLPPNSALNVTDHQGVVVHRYPAHPVVKPGLADRPDLRSHMTGAADEGVFREFGRDDVKRLLAFKRLRLHTDDAPYLYIRVSVPEKTALAGVWRLAFIYIALFVGAWLLALLFARRLAGHFLVDPLERISLVFRAAGQGDFTARTLLEYGHDEIGMLAKSIDGMAASLEVRHKEREQADAVRLEMERELRESERRFRELLERIHLLAVILDKEGNILFCNEYLFSLTGWSREELLGKNWFEVFLGEADALQVRQMFLESMTTGEMPTHFENPIATRSGGRRAVVWDNVVLRGGDGAVVGSASIGIDVTEHRSIEEQLLQSQKMEAIGQLAGGVAHDFNNLLTPILGYAEMVRKELAGYGGKADRVDHITTAALKARDLTRQLLGFSRKQAMDMKVVDLNQVISDFAAILHRTIREEIAIRLELSPEICCVHADRGQMEQVIMNLVVNAQDAIEGKGRILIETTRVDLDEEFVHQHIEVAPGAYVMLIISDSGLGIEFNVLSRIFEPFFTTKGDNKGTGLGLAMVYGIIKQHGGHIWVYSEPGKGTTFKIYLPCAEGFCTQLSREAGDSPVREHIASTILLVEDNEFVRALAFDLLTDLGHEVLVAEEPARALELVEGRVIDLLLSDVVMPGMSGPELYEILMQRQPGLKVLFMSGYTNNVVAQHVELKEGVNFIQKPFVVDLLSRKVADILHG